MEQYAPWPDELEAAVRELAYKPGYHFRLRTLDRDFADEARTKPIAGGLTFEITVPCHDSYHPDQYRPVTHYHPVPAATFNRASWERWLIDRVLETERHEAAEYFRFVETEIVTDDEITGGRREVEISARRPFAPTHGPGDDPYVLHEYATAEQRGTSFRGVVKGQDDDLLQQRILRGLRAHIEPRRQDRAFMERLGRRIEEDRHILDRLADGGD